MKRDTLQKKGAMMSKKASTMKDCIMMKDGKMMVMKGGKSMVMDKEMMMSNGSKVMPNGEVMTKGGKTMMLPRYFGHQEKVISYAWRCPYGNTSSEI